MLTGGKSIVTFTDPGYESALIGETTDGRAVYAYDLMIDYLMTVHGMDEEAAIEYVNTNSVGCLGCIGDCAPVIVMRKEVD